MSRQWRSDDTVPWTYGFGSGSYDATFGNEAASWDGTTRFQAQGAITGTAGQTSFVKPVGWAHTGFCLLHQTQGTGAGNWELAFVDFSGASAVSDKPLQNTYAAGAQIVTLSNGYTGYKNVNVSGTFTTPAWNGSSGGILAILASGTVTVTGAIGVNGATGNTAAGVSADSATTSGGGFRGGAGQQRNGVAYGTQGEGATGAGGGSAAANGMGGGAGINPSGVAGSTSGGGGGHGAAGTAGAAGDNNGGGQAKGAGGSAAGVAGLTTIFLGGGGGGAESKDGVSQTVASGGSGGGILFIIAKAVDFSAGTININGGNGGTGSRYAHGGGGAGGSGLIKAKTAVLGTNKITASGGTTSGGGTGAVGRIHLDYSLSYSGSTSPAIDVTNDLTIIEVASGAFFQMF